MALCGRYKFLYTRYVDDLTISGQSHLRNFVRLFQKIVRDEGYQLKPYDGGFAKIRWKNQSQEVTGLLVNGKRLNTTREFREEIYSELHVTLAQDAQEVKAKTIGQLAWAKSINPKVFKRPRKFLEERRKQ